MNGTGKEENMFITAIQAMSFIALMRPFCAPDGAGSGGSGAGAEDASGNTNAAAGTEDQKNAEPSFDDMLKNKAYQSEFDKRINKALETAHEKWEADAKAQADEAAKLAKMKADEKAEYERQKREDALAKREAEITRRELHAEAVTQLTEKGLPASLADIVDCTSAEKCKASMEAVEKAFNEAVEKKTNDKLKGTPPKTGGNNQPEDAFLAGLGVK